MIITQNFEFAEESKVFVKTIFNVDWNGYDNIVLGICKDCKKQFLHALCGTEIKPFSFVCDCQEKNRHLIQDIRGENKKYHYNVYLNKGTNALHIHKHRTIIFLSTRLIPTSTDKQNFYFRYKFEKDKYKESNIFYMNNCVAFKVHQNVGKKMLKRNLFANGILKEDEHYLHIDRFSIRSNNDIYMYCFQGYLKHKFGLDTDEDFIRSLMPYLAKFERESKRGQLWKFFKEHSISKIDFFEYFEAAKRNKYVKKKFYQNPALFMLFYIFEFCIDDIDVNHLNRLVDIFADQEKLYLYWNTMFKNGKALKYMWQNIFFKDGNLFIKNIIKAGILVKSDKYTVSDIYRQIHHLKEAKIKKLKGHERYSLSTVDGLHDFLTYNVHTTKTKKQKYKYSNETIRKYNQTIVANNVDYKFGLVKDNHQLSEVGIELNHCVASYHNMIIKNCFIVDCHVNGVRKLTIEMIGDKMAQCRGKNNRLASKEEKVIVEQWLKLVCS